MASNRKLLYETAANYVRNGLWVIDPEAGTITSTRLRRKIGAESGKGYTLVPVYIGGGVGRTIPAHRVIWESVNGPIPEGYEINHKNFIRSDNRMANLELVTRRGNIMHALNAGRFTNRLTPAQVIELRHKAAAGVTTKDLAAEYHMHPGAIRAVVTGAKWGHIGGPTSARYRHLRREDVEAIRAAHVEGVRNCVLAQKYKVDRSTISNIVLGQTWASLAVAA